MDILIIGNGFDLAHGLKTSYKDFLNYCGNLSSDDKLNKNLWLRYFQNLISKNMESGETWIDFEKEIYKQICKLRKIASGYYEVYILSGINPKFVNNPSINAYFKENAIEPSSLSAEAIQSNEDKINFVYNQLRDFTRAFGVYLNKHLDEKFPTTSSSPYQLKLRNSPQDTTLKVISFNYTDTCERLYSDTYNSIEPIYVHGQASNSDDCKLVLGTKSFGEDVSLATELKIFQKHNQRLKYGTLETYQDFLVKLRSILSPTFHVIGHSLDETDHNLLKNIFDENKDIKRINVYYHEEPVKDKLIRNITDLLTEDVATRKVQFINLDEDKILIRKEN